MDFAHDQLAKGKKFRILTVVDTYKRVPPFVDVRFNYLGDVVAMLERACEQTGYPKTIQIGLDMNLWAYKEGAILCFSGPDKPRTIPSLKRLTEGSGSNACIRIG